MRLTKIRSLAFSVFALGVLGGCVDKPGSRLDAAARTLETPAVGNSQVGLSDDLGLLIAGPNAVEASLINDERMQEVNSGGAAKQRFAVRLPVRIAGHPDWWYVQGSAASDMRAERILITFAEDGSPKTVDLSGVSTLNSVVQDSVTRAVAAQVDAWRAATEAERDVLLKTLDTQAKAGDAAAGLAASVIRTLMGTP